jgi:hypothetical protein
MKDKLQAVANTPCRFTKCADHYLRPRKLSGRTEQQNWEEALREIVTFLEFFPDGNESELRRESR